VRWLSSRPNCRLYSACPSLGSAPAASSVLASARPCGWCGWSPSPLPRAPVSAVNAGTSPCHRYPALGSAPCSSSSRAERRVASSLTDGSCRA
jgi:hypothetical protein